jgi:hypothetical protein
VPGALVGAIFPLPKKCPITEIGRGRLHGSLAAVRLGRHRSGVGVILS